MSFGFGVGDFLAVGKLAWAVYKSCKDAPESFNNISVEVLSLHAVLKEVEEALADEPLTVSKQRSLATIGNGCQTVLNDLQALVVKYESLGSQSRRTWDRMRWGSNDIAELRARLTSNTMLLTAFLMTSQVVVERKLNKLVLEFQEGKHEGSVITVATVESLAPDEKDTWRAIRKELEDIGISVLAFDANRPFIMDWFQTAIRSGAFEEQGVDSDRESLSFEDVVATRIGPLQSQGHQISDRRLLMPPSPYVNTRDQVSEVPETRERNINDEQIVDDPNKKYSNSSQALTAPASPWKLADSGRTDPGHIPRNVHPPRITKLMARVLGYDAAFSRACENGDLEQAKKFLLKGADINSTRHITTALGFAASRGNIPLASWLLDSGADINLYDKTLMSPLLLSIRKLDWNQPIPMTEMLLRRGAKVNNRLWLGIKNPLYQAASLGNTKAIVLLLEYGARWSREKTYSPLIQAIRVQKEDIVQILLEHMSNLGDVTQGDEEFQSAFEDCVRRSSSRCLKIFLEYGADVNFMPLLGCSVLVAAIEAGRYENAKILLERGAKVDWETDSHFITKFLSDDDTSPEDVELVGKRLDLSLNDAIGLTPLDWAMQHRHFEIAQQFLDLGAKSNVMFWRGGGSKHSTATNYITSEVVTGYEKFDSIQQK